MMVGMIVKGRSSERVVIMAQNQDELDAMIEALKREVEKAGLEELGFKPVEVLDVTEVYPALTAARLASPKSTASSERLTDRERFERNFAS
jgi:hypothetical protein